MAFTRPSLRVLGAILAVLALTWLPESAASAARGATGRKISAADRRLARVEHRIAAAQRGFGAARESLQRIAARTAGELASFDLLQQQLMDTRNRVQAARDRYTAERNALDARAREAFMQGPANGFEVVLGASSMSDLMDRMEFLNDVQLSDVSVAGRTQTLAAQLQTRQHRENTLFQDRAASLAHLTAKRDRLGAAFALEQTRLRNLADARSQLEGLLQQLRGRLRAQQLAAARAALGAGTRMPYGAWATAFLGAIGAPVSHSNLVALVAWQSAEGTDATYNPLATTYRMPGSTDFNSVGVQNYSSLAQGLDAIHRTLLASGHGYEQILAALAASADAMTTGQAINASDWCHGCASGQYVIELIPVVEQYYTQFAAR
jgi:peptidoglycan hydrolase CwlO-like protein